MKNKALYYDTIKGWLESCKTPEQVKIATEAIETLYKGNFGTDDYSVRLFEIALEKMTSIHQDSGVDIFDTKNMD